MQTPLSRCRSCKKYIDAPPGHLCEACATWRPRVMRRSPYLEDNVTWRLAPAACGLLLLGLPVVCLGILVFIWPFLAH
mgnify:CR=1 FL=1